MIVKFSVIEEQHNFSAQVRGTLLINSKDFKNYIGDNTTAPFGGTALFVLKCGHE